MKDYDKDAEGIIKEMGVTFTATRIGCDCPPFCKDKDKPEEMGKLPRRTHIHGDHFVVMLGRDKPTSNGPCAISFNFWDSYKNAFDRWAFAHPSEALRWMHKYELPWKQKSKTTVNVSAMRSTFKKARLTPSAYEVIACLQKCDPGAFDDFCNEIGMSSDSIKDLNTYLAVQKEFANMNAFFTKDELEKLQEIS